MNQRMHTELARLFGAPVVKRAAVIDPACLELSAALMDQVHDAADALLERRGKFREQMAYVNTLTPNVRLVLCMWLMDTGLAAKLIRAVYAAA